MAAGENPLKHGGFESGGRAGSLRDVMDSYSLRPRWPQARREYRAALVLDHRHEAARAASWAKGLGTSYAPRVAVNLPRSVLRNRASFPFVLISLKIEA